MGFFDFLLALLEPKWPSLRFLVFYKISSQIANSHSYNIYKAYVQENPASIPNRPNRQGAKYTQKRIKKIQHCRCGHHREDVCHYLLHCPNWARQRRVMFRSIRQSLGDRIAMTEHLLLGVSIVRVSAAQQRAIVSAVAVFAKSTIADRWWVW